MTGVTGLRIIEAVRKGDRDGVAVAKLDRHCQSDEAELAQALEGRYRDEHLLELKLCHAMWRQCHVVIAELDAAIVGYLERVRKEGLPALSAKPRARRRKPLLAGGKDLKPVFPVPKFS